MAVAETTAHQKEHIARFVKYESKEMGLLLYYIKFAYINPTLPLAGLSTGQRDINSSILAPTIRALEAQKYDTDLRNPYELMVGQFDLSFVILYLFPLVIIVLCYNLYSQEKEQGTWPLVKAQCGSARAYLLKKISVPFVFVMVTLVALYAIAVVLLAIPFNSGFISYMISNFLYVGFWFAVATLVVSFYKSSAVNAICLLSIWLLLTLLLPAAINDYITKSYPVPESLNTMLKQRDGYHKKWDIPKDSTMKLFFTEYPQYASYKWTAAGFDWLWYYAMQHMGDAEAKIDRDLFRSKLIEREKTSKQFSWFIPTIYIQLYSNDLAQSSLENHLQFLASTTGFHEQLRLYFYPKIFTAAPVSKEDWDNFKPAFSQTNIEADVLNSFYLGLYILIVGGIGYLRLKNSY